MTQKITTDPIALLRRLDPLREQDLVQLLEAGRASGGAERILATPRRRARVHRAVRAPRLASAQAFGLAAVAAAFGAAVLAFSLVSSSAPPAAALSFSEHGGFVLAKIVNPYASVAEMRSELKSNHLHVTLKLLPVPAGSVGKVAMIDVNGGAANGVQPLTEGVCANGPCAVGVKVARSFTGTGYVEIGRAARPGEKYESTPIGGAFAPGEQLHCSGLQGASVAKVLPALAGRKLSVVRWRMMASGSSTAGSGAPSSDLVEEVLPVSPGNVELWVAPAGRAKSFSTLHSASMHGCGTS
jgi:hypothetical protein